MHNDCFIIMHITQQNPYMGCIMQACCCDLTQCVGLSEACSSLLMKQQFMVTRNLDLHTTCKMLI